MSANTSIEWTDRTWNPVRGCSIVSPGCVNCYAMKQAHRFSGPGQPYAGLTKLTKAGPQWTGGVRLVADALRDPLSWRKPARVFVNSMSDLFHEDVPDEFIEEVCAVMALAPQHTFQILTKRPRRMLKFSQRNATGGRIFHVAQQIDTMRHGAQSGAWPLPNVWLGVSVEDQRRANERIPLLLQTPAAVRFVSAEPLLGPIDLSTHLGTAPNHDDLKGLLHWVIVGGESGHHARRCDLEWIRSVLLQCQAAAVPCFVKQLGSNPLDSRAPIRDIADALAATGAFLKSSKGGDPDEWPVDLRVREFPPSAVAAR